VDQKYVLDVSALPLKGKEVLLRPSSIEKIKLADWKELTFLIREARTKEPVAFVRFNARHNSLGGEIPQLSTSGENKAKALNFFRTFKQSPFRLVLFSSMSFLEKRGVHYFFSGNGVEDGGVAHKKQIRQRIISHIRAYWGPGFDKSTHKFGEFPRIEIKELRGILAANKSVPKRLLPPESVLRKVRAKSFAHLELKRLGKENYRQMRKLRLAKK
jgi:hypothetical protein